MKNTILVLASICLALNLHAQYGSIASAFFASGNGETQHYGVLGSTFNMTMQGRDGLTVIHANNPALFGGMSTHILDFQGQSIDIEIGPNPADDFLRIAAPELQGELRLDLINSIGIIALPHRSLVEDELVIDVQELPAGLYYIRLTDLKSRRTQSYPIIINH